MYQGTNGYFWSLGATSATVARNLRFYGSSVDPEDYDYRSIGFSVRRKIYYRQFPFTLTYGGGVNLASGSTVDQSASGYFWSIGANSSTYARYLRFYGSNIDPEYGLYKSNGFSVRCKIYYRQVPIHAYVWRSCRSTVWNVCESSASWIFLDKHFKFSAKCNVDILLQQLHLHQWRRSQDKWQFRPL